MMSYFLRTLEGLGDTGGVANTFVSKYVPRYMNENLVDRYFFAFKDFVNDYPDIVYKSLVNDVIKYVRSLEGQWNQTGWSKLADNMAAWYTQFLRKNRDEQEAQAQAAQYAEAMKARAAAEAAAQLEEENAQRIENLRRIEEEEAAAVAQQAIDERAYLVDEIRENLAEIETGRRVLVTPEQEQIYKELTGRDYSEILEKDNELKQIVNESNEVEPMQEITLENQVVESLPTYTIIDETADSFVYEDEAGNIHIEPKAQSAAPWLILAAAAALFLS